MEEKKTLIGLRPDEIRTITDGLGMPAFTARQVADWLYRKRATEIDEMSNLSLKNRELLKHNCQVGRHDPAMVQTSVDGTRKYLFRTAAGVVEQGVRHSHQAGVPNADGARRVELAVLRIVKIKVEAAKIHRR